MDALLTIFTGIAILFLTGMTYMLGKKRGANKYSELVIKLLETDSKLLQNTIQTKWQTTELPRNWFRAGLQGLKECYTPRSDV
jgi:hypothetical protein